MKPIDRLYAKIKYLDNGCWLWTGKTKSNGYGQFTIDKKYIYVHRFSYEYHKAFIPEGLVIDHLCRNRACVNPDHLEPVTQRINLLRGETIPGIRALQTSCQNGHEFTPENTYVKPNGTRNCRTCKREAQARYMENK